MSIHVKITITDHVILKGDVRLVNESNIQAVIPDGAEIEGLVEV